jgi:hypothetical protein
MLLLRVEEIFIGSVNELKDQMNVPADVHADDHDWIKSHRDTESGVKSVAMKVSISLFEKGSLVGAGALAGGGVGNDDDVAAFGV